VLIENVMTCKRFPSVLGGLLKSVRFPTPDMGGHIMFSDQTLHTFCNGQPHMRMGFGFLEFCKEQMGVWKELAVWFF